MTCDTATPDGLIAAKELHSGQLRTSPMSGRVESWNLGPRLPIHQPYHLATLVLFYDKDKDTCDGCLKIFQTNSTGYMSCVPDTIPEEKKIKKLRHIFYMSNIN